MDDREVEIKIRMDKDAVSEVNWSHPVLEGLLGWRKDLILESTIRGIRQIYRKRQLSRICGSLWVGGLLEQ